MFKYVSHRDRAASILEEVAHLAKSKGQKAIYRTLMKSARSIRQRADIRKGWRLV